MASQHPNSSLKLRHLMTSTGFMYQELSHHLAGHTHGPSCNHGCGHSDDNAEHTDHEDQDGAIGE